MGSSNGKFEWEVRMGSSNGQFDWAVRLDSASATGLGAMPSLAWACPLPHPKIWFHVKPFETFNWKTGVSTLSFT